MVIGLVVSCALMMEHKVHNAQHGLHRPTLCRIGQSGGSGVGRRLGWGGRSGRGRVGYPEGRGRERSLRPGSDRSRRLDDSFVVSLAQVRPKPRQRPLKGPQSAEQAKIARNCLSGGRSAVRPFWRFLRIFAFSAEISGMV